MEIADALVQTISLDNRQFLRESANSQREIRRTRDEADSAAKNIEASGKRAASFVRGLRNEAVGLFLAFAGASSLKAFAADIVTGDAATGRLAANLGVATSRLSTWQAAVRTVGGDTRDANAAIAAMASAFQGYKLTGTTGHDADFQGLGVSLNDLSDPSSVLLRMAEASERMSRPEFVARMQRIGIPDSVITTLTRGRAATEELLREQERLGVANDASSEAAQRFEARLAELKTALLGSARGPLLQVVDAALLFTNQVDLAAVGVPILTGVLGALGIATIAATGPWIALAAAIAATVALARASPQQRAEILEDIRAGRFRDGLATAFGAGPRDPSVTPGWMDQARSSVSAYVSGGASSGRYASFFRANGFTPAQAAGIAAGIGAEGGTPSAVNRTSGAFGIGQWLGPRKRALFARYGSRPTEAQQLEFLLWELRGGDAGGPSVGRQSSADGALNAYIRNFMRPAAGAETFGDISRGRRILVGGGAPVGPSGGAGSMGGGSQSTTIGTIVVNTAATDAPGIARDLRGAIAQRGLVTQSNGGLTP